MVEHGGLHTLGDVKALVLYILHAADRAMEREHLTEIVLNDGLVDYFDFSQGLQELLQEGLIDIISPEETNTFIITDVGIRTKELYEKNIPFNVKKYALAALTKTLAKIRRESNTHTEVSLTEGGYLVTCRLTEQEKTLLEYKVLVPDEMQAHIIADQFLKHPTEKYQSIMAALIDENLFN